MFSLMGNCVSCIKRRREPKRPINLAILGLDCAGKTTTTKGLLGEPLEDAAPTVGFNSENFTISIFDITLYDLGGGKSIREIWTTYLPEVYGIIYVVDATASDRIDELRDNFKKLIENQHVAGKPVLVLANKQDKPNAMDEVEICEEVNLETTVNIHKCPCKIETCSALRGTGRKMDPVIKEGMQWLCDIIEKNYEKLKTRVDKDTAEAAEIAKAEAQARRERVQKIREERARAEEEERKKLGIEKEEELAEDFVDGDPFKRVDVEELKKKEAMLKAEKKKKKKEKEDHNDANLSENNSSKTPRSLKSQGLPPLGQDLEKLADESDEVIGSSSRSKQILPPLQQPLGTKFMEDSTTTKKKKKRKPKQQNVYTQNELNTFGTPRAEELNVHESQGQKSLRSVSKISVTTNSLGDVREGLVPLAGSGLTPLDGGEDVTPKGEKTRKSKVLDEIQHNGFELQDVSDLTPASKPRPLPKLTSLDLNGDSESTPRKKKKKKLKKNQLSPSEDNDSLPSTRGDHSSRSHQFETRSPLKHVSDELDTGNDFATKWGLVEELPEVSDSVHRRKPNYDDDDDIVL